MDGRIEYGHDTGVPLSVVVKLRFPCRLDKLSIALYLAQGWLVLFALDSIMAALLERARAARRGGVVYTIGVAFNLLERMRFHKLIWHLFVLGVAACRFIAGRAVMT